MEQILILEDDIALNQGLCKALKTENRKIVSCETIKVARDQLLCGCPSLILLDINLPDGSGLDFLQELKRNYPTIPVILLTANDTDMGIVRVKHQVAGLCVRPRNIGAVRVLHRGAAAMSDDVTAARGIVKGPIHESTAI